PSSSSLHPHLLHQRPRLLGRLQQRPRRGGHLLGGRPLLLRRCRDLLGARRVAHRPAPHVLRLTPQLLGHVPVLLRRRADPRRRLLPLLDRRHHPRAPPRRPPRPRPQ